MKDIQTLVCFECLDHCSLLTYKSLLIIVYICKVLHISFVSLIFFFVGQSYLQIRHAWNWHIHNINPWSLSVIPLSKVPENNYYLFLTCYTKDNDVNYVVFVVQTIILVVERWVFHWCALNATIPTSGAAPFVL